MKSVNVVFGEVMVSLADVDANGNVSAFDYDGLGELIKLLQAKKKELADEIKESKKEAKAEENAAKAEIGKAYYDSLSVGDFFMYKDSKGVEHFVEKIETKSKSGATASCRISEADLQQGKTKRERYPKFYQVIVPEDFAQVA